MAVARTEPYGIVNCWKEVHGNAGEGGSAFLSGTISTLFRAFYEGMLGFRPTLNGLVIKPCLPGCWPKVSYRCRFKGYRLNIAITNCADLTRGQKGVVVNGRPLPDFTIPESCLDQERENHIEVMM